MPTRCDNVACQFSTLPLIWNDKPLPLIMDHVNGNHCDNSPANLRLLCPNCDAQLSTRGGANRGRVKATYDGGYVLDNFDGTIIAAGTGTASACCTVTGAGEAVVAEPDSCPAPSNNA